MDPKARRAMWDYLINLKSGAFSTEPRGIILTTHSMEEADALSDNIAIMVRGQLRALGPRYENGSLCSPTFCTFKWSFIKTGSGQTQAKLQN
jgi:ABC-type multidrug transport system ATPase subunit